MASALKHKVSSEKAKKKPLEINPVKVIQAKKHLGKVAWGEDALAYQKRKRNEWG